MQAWQVASQQTSSAISGRCFGDSVAYIEDDLTVRCYHDIIA